MRLFHCFFNENVIHQFFSYLLVGGIATIVEWLCFYIFFYFFSIYYLLATALAFFISTMANWVTGKLLTFRNIAQQSTVAELGKIYVVSVAGLLFNLMLMYVFVQRFSLPSMLSKIIATGIVFMWNFLTRKLWIYREGESS